MGRRPLYTCTDDKMRKLILKYGIDEQGNKVSLRDLFSNEDFLRESQYYHITLGGNKVPVSLGSVNDLQKKLKLMGQNMWDYYNKKGLVSDDYTSWINKGKGNNRSDINGDMIKVLLCEFFRLKVDVHKLTLDEVKDACMNSYLDKGLSIEDYREDYKYFMNIHKLKDKNASRYRKE